MALINNATGVYATLGYNFSDPNGAVQTLSASTQAHLNTIPAMVTSWQAQDIANNSVSGYFQNPVSSSTISIGTSANSLYISANSVINRTTLSSIITASTSLAAVVPGFINHTDYIYDDGVYARSQQSHGQS